MNKKRKQVLFGLGILTTITSTAIGGMVVSVINNSKIDNSITNNQKLNNNQAVSSSIARSTINNLDVNNYNPVISSQHHAASTTFNGYIGYGFSEEILDSSNQVVMDNTTNKPLTDDRRAVYFTTFDGILRWKFDLNELNTIANKLTTETSDLRIVDIKPIDDVDSKNIGYIVLAAASGVTKNSGSFGSNVIFMIDSFGNLITDSVNEFNLPDFGIARGGDLIGNTQQNINVISPYSIKTSYSSNSSTLIQISANPFAIKTNNKAYKWKLSDYLSFNAITNDFDAEGTGEKRTAPIVLLEFDHRTNNFKYESKTNAQGKKVLKNHSTSNVFDNFVKVPSETYILSEMMFYMKAGILGFYGSFLLPGQNDNEKRLNISTYTLESNKLVLNNTIMNELISSDPNSKYNELFDYKNYASDYNGYTYSYVPSNYKNSYNSPAATLLLPFSATGNVGYYVIQMFDQVRQGEKKISNWIADDIKRIPKGSFIDPIYGNMFIPVEGGKKIEYIDVSFENDSGSNSIPNQFDTSTFSNDNENIFDDLSAIFPLSTNYKVYNSKNQHYGKFAFASFNNEGKFKVLYLSTNMSASTTNSTIHPANNFYSLSAYEDVQKRSEILKWTPKIKKVSEITDAMLSTIGNYKTVPAGTPPENLPLFYLKLLADNETISPLNKLSVSNVVRKYEETTIEFDASFSYKAYTDDDYRVYTQKYSINDFKNDATMMSNTTFKMPSRNASGQPLIVASPIAYQGTYNPNFNYVAGQQTAIDNGQKTLVYQLKKDKPASVIIHEANGSLNQRIFRDYFEVVKTFDNKDQTPYTFDEVKMYKGIFNQNITYQRGDVVKDSLTNKLYIFTTRSNTLLNAQLFQGTDLSTLLPSELTNNHIAMIVEKNMVEGTIPDGFSINDIELYSVVKTNLAENSPTNSGIITANVKLRKYIDQDGQLQTSSSNFKSVPITINFDTSSRPTLMTQEYKITDFGGLLNDLYAYQLDNTFIQKNPSFTNSLIQFNQKNGNFTNDITASNIFFNNIQNYNEQGIVDIQVGLSRWYDDEGILNNTTIKHFSIRVTGFKKATVTELTINKIALRPNQVNVPGLGGFIPSQVTVNKFLSSEKNIKDFILNYVNIENNTKLIIDSARPAYFNENSINIISSTGNSANGSISLTISFNRYFDAQNIAGQERIIYRQGTSKETILYISGFKKFVDNSVDNLIYDATMNINSTLSQEQNWPIQLKALIDNRKASIPESFYKKNGNNMDTILKSAVLTLLSTKMIDGANNNLYIDNVTINDIGNITECYYNNFTGKIIFKANLRKFVRINEDGTHDVIDNSTRFPNNWQTVDECKYSISLNGFSSVKASIIDGQELPTIKDNVININSNIKVDNKDTLSITYQDIKDQVKWEGSFAVYNGNDFEVKTMEEIMLGSQNPFTKEPFIKKNITTGVIEVIFEFDKPVYYFAQKDIPTDITNPYLMGNLGETIEIAKGGRIILTLNSIKKFDVWSIVFYIGVGLVGVIILSLIWFLIAKGINRRKVY